MITTEEQTDLTTELLARGAVEKKVNRVIRVHQQFGYRPSQLNVCTEIIVVGIILKERHDDH